MGGLLNGRTAVITGAARGLGYAMARGFLQQGARVLVADVDKDAVAAATEQLAAEGLTEAVGVTCDVTDELSVAELAERGARDELRVWVNNAGILRNGDMADMPLSGFRSLIDVHVQGSWLGCKYAGMHIAEGGGAIVNISSIGGKAGLAGQTNYSTAKAAILGLTKAAAKELAPRNIRVNTILPGIMRTAMAEQLAPEDLAARLTDVPLGRIGEPHEIADAAVFLASDMSTFVTGAALEVSGGRFM
ncbi:MAG: 3-oxoacyl-[acyl-carrier-protein] reductase [Pseudonocardia sp. SCN 72-86]|nr:MAG: 3-oxoacyl-[acyl-carrier-protein] reductase [Pseudonocardia sp. SCN 72-86]